MKRLTFASILLFLPAIGAQAPADGGIAAVYRDGLAFVAWTAPAPIQQGSYSRASVCAAPRAALTGPPVHTATVNQPAYYAVITTAPTARAASTAQGGVVAANAYGLVTAESVTINAGAATARDRAAARRHEHQRGGKAGWKTGLEVNG